jgi:chaperonin GroEL (HSP60 family)
VEVGVFGGTQVVRVTLQNAASVASIMLTTEALIAKGSDGDSIATGAEMAAARAA